jgi:hypothetical protein
MDFELPLYTVIYTQLRNNRIKIKSNVSTHDQGNMVMFSILLY